MNYLFVKSVCKQCNGSHSPFYMSPENDVCIKPACLLYATYCERHLLYVSNNLCNFKVTTKLDHVAILTYFPYKGIVYAIASAGISLLGFKSK